MAADGIPLSRVPCGQVCVKAGRARQVIDWQYTGAGAVYSI